MERRGQLANCEQLMLKLLKTSQILRFLQLYYKSSNQGDIKCGGRYKIGVEKKL